MLAGMGKNPGNLLGKYAYQSGAVGSYFDAPSDHMATPLLKTPEEREVFADRGVQAINEFVKALDMPTIVETLRQVDVYTKDSILPKYAAQLPGEKA
jgi:creatinine amidohydrolase